MFIHKLLSVSLFSVWPHICARFLKTSGVCWQRHAFHPPKKKEGVKLQRMKMKVMTMVKKMVGIQPKKMKMLCQVLLCHHPGGQEKQKQPPRRRRRLRLREKPRSRKMGRANVGSKLRKLKKQRSQKQHLAEKKCTKNEGKGGKENQESGNGGVRTVEEKECCLPACKGCSQKGGHG